MSTLGRYTAKQMARDITRQGVLRAIQSHTLISRSQLAEMLPVSRATISGVVAELIAAGLVEEADAGQSTGGRRPIRLRLRPESRSAVGVIMFDNRVRATLTDLAGRPIRHVEIGVQGTDPNSMLCVMRQAVEQVIAGLPCQYVVGVGVGVPGVVDHKTGAIRISISLGWRSNSANVKEYLEQSLGLPIFVANRSRVAALGECQIGVAQGMDNLVYLFLGQGIAAGIVIDGQLYFGPASSAGEIGHVSIFPDGPLCACGNRGCLEVYATDAALLARARALARESPSSRLNRSLNEPPGVLTIADVVQSAEEGDSAALKVFDEGGTHVGMAVATLISLFNPKMVVVGGPTGCVAGHLLLPPIAREARHRTLPHVLCATRIVAGTLGLEAGAVGAAVLAITHTPIARLIGG